MRLLGVLLSLPVELTKSLFAMSKLCVVAALLSAKFTVMGGTPLEQRVVLIKFAAATESSKDTGGTLVLVDVGIGVLLAVCV